MANELILRIEQSAAGDWRGRWQRSAKAVGPLIEVPAGEVDAWAEFVRQFDRQFGRSESGLAQRPIVAVSAAWPSLRVMRYSAVLERVGPR